MPRPTSKATTLALAAALLLALPACGKKSLDKSVDKLVKAALANDYQAFKEMSHPSLVDKFSAEKLKLLSASLKALGSFKDRSMRGIKARSGGIREGRYKLTFAKGTVQLKVTLRKGKLIAFLFSGDDLEKAMHTVRGKVYAEFKVGSFSFVDDDGARKNNVYKAGQKIRFKVSVYGMKRQGGTLKLTAGVQVVDTAGKVVLQNPKYVDSAVPLKPDDHPVGNVTGAITLKTPGHYTMKIRITDGHSGKTLEHKTAVLVEK